MLKLENSLARFFLNFLISLGLFWLFTQIGWIQVGPEHPFWMVALAAVVISMVVGIILGFVLFLLSPFIIIVAFLTLGLGLVVLMPVVQYFTLYLTAKATLLFTITTVWWQAVIIGLAFGWLKFTAPSSSK